MNLLLTEDCFDFIYLTYVCEVRQSALKLRGGMNPHTLSTEEACGGGWRGGDGGRSHWTYMPSSGWAVGLLIEN